MSPTASGPDEIATEHGTHPYDNKAPGYGKRWQKTCCSLPMGHRRRHQRLLRPHRHHLAMERIRRRSGDRKANKLILRFLKAGVLSEEQFIRTDAGLPKGGIVSPLLANIALGVIEERY